MASTFPVAFGPTFNPRFEPEGAFWFDDFIGFGASATADATPWENVSTTGSVVTNSADPWGAVNVACDDDGDGGIELNGEPFAFDHTKDIMFGCRFKVSALGSSIFMGLHTEDFDVQSGSLEQNHIGFGTQTDANLDFTCGNTTGQTITDTTQDLVASTWYIAVWRYTAVDRTIRFYVDGDLKGSVVVGVANLPATGTQLTVGIHNEADGTGGQVLTVDYVYVGGER